jgi:transglutaminase-like putative cysteine protease
MLLTLLLLACSLETISTSISPTATPVPVSTSPPHTPAPPEEPVSFQNPQRYHVEYVVTVYNEGFDLDELRVCQPRPIQWDGQAEVEIEEVSPSPTTEGLDLVFGNGMYYWQLLGEPSRGGSTAFRIEFSVTAYETRTSIQPAEVQPYNKDDPLYARHTQSERFIMAADPLIVKTADELAGGETNPYLLARKFYDSVIDTADYQLLGQGLRGARELLTTGVGECGDYAALFVALCRAKGIPARPVVGYWAISGIEQTHVWAEFYVEPFGWIPVDPTVGQSEPAERDYYFGNMDNQRIILNKGFNIQLDPPGPEGFIAPFLQVPQWWFWGSGGDADAVRIERTSWEVTSVP